MREILAPVLDRLFDEGTPGRSELARLFAIIMPGIIVVFWSLMTLTNGSLAQALLTRFGVGWRHLPPSPRLSFRGGFLVLCCWLRLGGMMRFVGLAVLPRVLRRYWWSFS